MTIAKDSKDLCFLGRLVNTENQLLFMEITEKYSLNDSIFQEFKSGSSDDEVIDFRISKSKKSDTNNLLHDIWQNTTLPISFLDLNLNSLNYPNSSKSLKTKRRNPWKIKILQNMREIELKQKHSLEK